MQIFPIPSRKIETDDDLAEVLLQSLKKAKMKLEKGDIIAIVSKVVSLTEGRLVDLGYEQAGKKSSRDAKTVPKRYGVYEASFELDALIRREIKKDDKLYQGEMYLAIKDGIFTPSAGIDTSNVPENHAILWPRDSYKSAEKIRTALRSRLKSGAFRTTKQPLGILIFDSFLLPLRRGATGIALGYSGFHGIHDERKKDIFGKKLKVSFTNVADNLAAAATLLTGEADEKIPFILIRGAPAIFTDKKIQRKEIQLSPEECVYNGLYKR